jgi:hypothetical protein
MPFPFSLRLPDRKLDFFNRNRERIAGVDAG